jgi:AcrR family transcriptional regulator
MIRFRIAVVRSIQYGTVSDKIAWVIERTMLPWSVKLSTPTRGEKWINAAFKALARGGVEEVRVEVLAKDLGVTKGGFYRAYSDRRALLNALLERWRVGRITAIEAHTRGAGGGPTERLRELIRLYSESVNPEGMAIELAIRQWARSDRSAALAVADVDAARLKNVAAVYASLGLDHQTAEARAFLFYSFIFGQSLLASELGAAKRAKWLKICSAMLTDGAGTQT